MEKILQKKWFSVVYAIGSMFVGHYLIGHELITHKAEWEVVSYVLTNNLFVWLFMIFGLAKLLGVIFNMKKLKYVSLAVLNSGWALLAVSFYLQNRSNPNTGWLFAGIIFFFGIGIALRGGADE